MALIRGCVEQAPQGRFRQIAVAAQIVSHHAVSMAAAMTAAAVTVSSFWECQQGSSSSEEAAMGKKAVTECFLMLESASKKRRASDEMDEAGAVRVTKRFRRSSSVHLMDVALGPTTPPTKDLAQIRSRSEAHVPSSSVRQSHSCVAPSRKQLETSTLGLDKLPWELKLRVLQHLPVKDLCQMSQVNKSYHALATCDLLWALQCYRSSFCRATLEESWKWNYMAATIGIVHAKLLDDSNPSHMLRIQGDAYIIDPMHAFFTSDIHRWRWTQEVLPILDALQNADVIVTYRGLQCAVIQTRFGEGAYQVTRRRRPVGTVFSSSGFMAVIPRALMELLREEDGTPTGTDAGMDTGTGTDVGTKIGTGSGTKGATNRCEADEGTDGASGSGTEAEAEAECRTAGVLVRNLDGTLFTSRTGDFLVSAVRRDRGTVEAAVGLDVPVDVLVTTGGDWSVDEDDDEEDDEELDEDDVRFLEDAMCAEKAPARAPAVAAASKSDSSRSESGLGSEDGATSQDCSCISASDAPAESEE
ncbi:hypothetical protein KFL_006720050 [Klebsormidium nitens]|uniref:F-box domain-containing protein n=1 Tax=Klebsormidium nitens TaxID=105231 RepID=A0A1Y1IRB4_KLENI|nr:hypothetical protein KFL_006720050 [Klebsormidium nitens]|eukprot:GAQ90678.1 hypothetical protein KFL_006720050 [Klebsormidium nitens]